MLALYFIAIRHSYLRKRKKENDKVQYNKVTNFCFVYKKIDEYFCAETYVCMSFSHRVRHKHIRRARVQLKFVHKGIS